MPQPGVHAIIALACRKKLPVKPMLATGVVFGSMVPDLDGYAQAVATIGFRMDPSKAEAMFHRTLTHSLLFAVGLGLLVWFAGTLRKSDEVRGFGIGLTIGMAVFHSFLDVFAWFDGVGILWPFASINLWSQVHLNDTIANLLRAGNFLAFGLFLYYLERLAGYQKASMYSRGLIIMSLSMAIIGIQLNSKLYGLIDGALLLLFAFPATLYWTWKHRHIIEGHGA